MENKNITFEQNHVGHFVYANMYNKNWSMVLGLSASFFNIFFTTPLFYFIVWYEKCGSDHPRTLLNQLVVSTWY